MPVPEAVVGMVTVGLAPGLTARGLGVGAPKPKSVAGGGGGGAARSG